GNAGNGAHGRFRLGPNALPRACLRGVDINREEYLAIVDGDRGQNVSFGQGDAARRHHLGQSIEKLLLRHAECVSPHIWTKLMVRSGAKAYRACAASGLPPTAERRFSAAPWPLRS